MSARSPSTIRFMASVARAEIAAHRATGSSRLPGRVAWHGAGTRRERRAARSDAGHATTYVMEEQSRSPRACGSELTSGSRDDLPNPCRDGRDGQRRADGALPDHEPAGLLDRHDRVPPASACLGSRSRSRSPLAVPRPGRVCEALAVEIRDEVASCTRGARGRGARRLVQKPGGGITIDGLRLDDEKWARWPIAVDRSAGEDQQTPQMRRLLPGLILLALGVRPALAQMCASRRSNDPWQSARNGDRRRVLQHWSQNGHSTAGQHRVRVLPLARHLLVVGRTRGRRADGRDPRGRDRRDRRSRRGRGSAEDARLPSCRRCAADSISVAATSSSYPGRVFASTLVDIAYLRLYGILDLYVVPLCSTCRWPTGGAARDALHAGGTTLSRRASLVGAASAAGFDGALDVRDRHVPGGMSYACARSAPRHLSASVGRTGLRRAAGKRRRRRGKASSLGATTTRCGAPP